LRHSVVVLSWHLEGHLAITGLLLFEFLLTRGSVVALLLEV